MRIKQIFTAKSTKLQEGNIFSLVCYYVQKGGASPWTITDDALDLIVQVPLALIYPDVKHGPPPFYEELASYT